MCQICGIKDIAARDRWPKPLEQQQNDLNFLITSAHDEATKYQSQKQPAKSQPAPEPLLELLRLLATQLDQLESDRQAWWSSPEKREQRRRFEQDCDQMKLTALNKTNNSSSDRIEAMNARLGGFVKWTLGMNGGIWELQESAKVNVAKKG
ncbi:hypothetical protein LTR37_004486 [Vermiconidia calcicola]|uniref:Uncharacterized protein n=1 Tax=Vermiconidia calcicola TaxID=1690605 RepID=A0ACC3NNK1_9PEZI|nr:hypothetical protein LTR37_004486 [Vermiconidia calcicola]